MRETRPLSCVNIKLRSLYRDENTWSNLGSQFSPRTSCLELKETNEKLL
jgi:hypothetical protein